MNIGIDLWEFSNKYPHFTKDLIYYFITQNNYLTTFFYVTQGFELSGDKIRSWKLSLSMSGRSALKKYIKSDDIDVLVSFEEHFPLAWQKQSISVVVSFEDVLFPSYADNTGLKKYTRPYKYKKSLNKSDKIITLSDITKNEINERFNISEEKIKVFSPFFPSMPQIDDKRDAKNVLGILGSYFIYDYDNQNNTNIFRLLDAFSKIYKEHQLYLLILGNENAQSREIRQHILQLKIEKNILFKWRPSDEDISLYYSQALWLLYPTAYNNFPLSLQYAIWYKTPIIASEGSEIQKVFWESIYYFSPNSTESITQALLSFLQKPKKYDKESIVQRYSVKHFWDALITLLQSYGKSDEKKHWDS